MGTHSSEFLEVDNYEEQPSLHRSRSGGYVDHLEERTKWDRRDCERQMKRYHDSKNSPSSSSHQRSTSDRLCVPAFETTTRRARSNESIGQTQHESSRSYNVQEVRPSTSPVYDLSSEPTPRRPQHQKKPSIKVQIHQDNPPSSTTPTGPTPKRSPSASPRSPTAQPQLQYQYATLQNKLAQISTTCALYLEVEAANPQHMTFAKIVEQVNGFAFDLQVWAHLVKLDSMAKIDSRKRKIVEAASRNLDRIMERATELHNVCAQAKPKDLKFEALPDVVDEDRLFEDGNGDWKDQDPIESLGFVIHSGLHSIELQIQTLKRLARSLQEATPHAKDEVVAVTRLIEETVQYFGSQGALDRYTSDARFVSGKALDETRYAAAR